MPQSRINFEALEADFESRQERAFSRADLLSIFRSAPLDWNLPRNIEEQVFIEMLLRRTKMREIKLVSSDYPLVVRYVWGKTVASVSVALSIKRHAFLSHSSAMWIHGIGGDENRIYINVEQSKKPRTHSALTQESIDRAFRNKQRRSRLVYKYNNATITVLSGKNSGNLEVGPSKTPSGEQVEATSLERTLIDITVRAAYAGGVAQVLEGFRRSRGRVSVEKVLWVLKGLDYIYPYHQAIGFYIKQAGYGEADQDLVRKLGTPFLFYLSHESKHLALDEDFKVFFPKPLK
jgi:hypothetical protein